MKHYKKLTFSSCVAALLAFGCYEFVSQTQVMSNAPDWTGASAWGLTGPQGVIGLAGQDVYWFDGGGPSFWNDPLIDEFGAPYVLTSAAQTHTMGHHEHSFIHGNLVGETDNLSLLYTYQGSPFTMDWVDPWVTTFYDGTTQFQITQICDMAASSDGSFGHPYESSSHMYLSFKACPVGGGTCSAGIMEITFDSGISWWWPKSVASTEQVTVRRASGPRFSHECMPIAVTRRGDQTTEFLVVGDPSIDELTVFDAFSIASGATDVVYVPDASRNIQDLTIEGRGDGSFNFGFLVTLWNGSGGARLEHRTIINGEFDDAGAMLIETVPNNVQAIATRGYGLEGSTGQLFSFGDQVMRRAYQQE